MNNAFEDSSDISENVIEIEDEVYMLPGEDVKRILQNLNSLKYDILRNVVNAKKAVYIAECTVNLS